MKLRIFLVLLSALFWEAAVLAQSERISAVVTITNKTVNGDTFTVNGVLRTFTNNVVNPATQVITNADGTGCGTATNLFLAINANPYPQIVARVGATNSFILQGNSGLPMAVTASAGYASVSYSTQQVATLIGAQVPVSALPTAAARTNVASGIVGAINSVENTNKISQVSTAASELMGTTNAQDISGLKRFTNAASQWFGIISNSAAISGTVIALAGGLFTSPLIASPTTTNLVNYGNAVSSPGTGTDSEQFGKSANASGVNSMAIGLGSSAAGDGSIAIGPNAYAPTNVGGSVNMAIGSDSQATANRSLAIGPGALANGDSSLAIGYQAEADAPSSQAIGVNSISTHTNSTAIGVGASTTAANQIMLGGSGINAVIQNDLTVQGNVNIGGALSKITFAGTNNFGTDSDIAFARKSVSSLANGNNAAVPIGTNVFIEVSGPSGAFTINGIANGRDGKMIVVVNQTGQNMTIAHDSGTDPTAANRIISMTGADRTTTGNGAAILIYSGAASRWLLISFDP